MRIRTLQHYQPLMCSGQLGVESGSFGLESSGHTPVERGKSETRRQFTQFSWEAVHAPAGSRVTQPCAQEGGAGDKYGCGCSAVLWQEQDDRPGRAGDEQGDPSG